MSAKIIALADHRPAPAGTPREPQSGPAQVVFLPPPARTLVMSAFADAGATANAGAINATASVAALGAACRDLANSLARIREHAQAVRDRMGGVSDGAEALVSTGTGIVDALRGVVALRPAFAEETARG
jgi:prophage DNA circulation protein